MTSNRSRSREPGTPWKTKSLNCSRGNVVFLTKEEIHQDYINPHVRSFRDLTYILITFGIIHLSVNKFTYKKMLASLIYNFFVPIEIENTMLGIFSMAIPKCAISQATTSQILG